ncbi:RHS repeat-associated core domain-containing protein [Ruminiclostridium herbifermentans]|uniref:RHS repeat-associated core domain-containing protein n=1 Tax=Ruminiclostridium herbifermentans TaxID=2488810 RepID=UPI001FD17806|nr:RHS repeat-associated core domain-containing protein [Ruminiclostridium herbifermentans]
MLTQTNGNEKTTYYEYNVANNLIKKIDHGGRISIDGEYKYIAAKTEEYTYNADGSIATMTDKNGNLTEYTYDIHGRLISKAIGSSIISYTYDNNGNQLTITDSTGTTVRTYDEQNRVLTKTVPKFGTTTYTYDNAEGNGLYSETTTDFKNNQTKKVYDKAGRLYQVIAYGKTTVYEYYGNGSRKSVTYNDGAKEEYTYYKNGLNKTLVNKKANGLIIDSYSYTYDGANNQTSKTDSKGVTNYSYDSLNRLVKTTEPNGKETSYTYDGAGNRLTETIKLGTSSVTTKYTYNEQNRLMSTVYQSGSQTVTEKYFYDNNGNTISKTTETAKPIESTLETKATVFKAGESPTDDDLCYDEVTLYEFDVWNQLIKTAVKDKKISYTYNGEGYRVSKDINGQTTNYLYEADKVILETDGENNQTARNIYGLNLLTRTVGNDTMNYMYNGHADVTALLNQEGIVTATYYYDAFGNIIEQTGNVNNNITYAGYQYDGETGLYYLNARMYDPKIARFLQEDTYLGDRNDPLSLNLYTYCHNEPVLCFLRGNNKNMVNSNKSV